MSKLTKRGRRKSHKRKVGRPKRKGAALKSRTGRETRLGARLLKGEGGEQESQTLPEGQHTEEKQYAAAEHQKEEQRPAPQLQASEYQAWTLRAQKGLEGAQSIRGHEVATPFQKRQAKGSFAEQTRRQGSLSQQARPETPKSHGEQARHEGAEQKSC
nr:hypothetical protein BaRGS_000239 [Batillaria attramentaria]